jgi:hypothetical protein
VKYLHLAWKHHPWFLLALLLVAARMREPQLAPTLMALPVVIPSYSTHPDRDYFIHDVGEYGGTAPAQPRVMKRHGRQRPMRRAAAQPRI